MDETSPLRVSLLGRLAASYDGEPLDLGGRRQRAVLAVLVLARGDLVPVERLVEAVWGEHAGDTAVGALQSYVSHLRRRLQPGSAARARSAVIVREGPGYAVRLPAEAVDAWRFEALVSRAERLQRPAEAAEALREALELWAGPALAEYADEPWAAADVARLTELRRVARERLLVARLEVEDPAVLVPELEALVQEDPLREERWRALALALYRSQRQADALAALRTARRTLADELGVDPGPALQRLEAAVLAHSPDLLPAPAAPTAPTPPAAPGAPAAAGTAPLVERHDELATLRGAVEALARRRSGLVVVQGPAGIGKTRLLLETGRLAAERSVRLLTARGSQLETAFAHGVVRQLLGPALGEGPGREELLRDAGAARGVLDLAEEGRVDGFAVLDGLHRLVAALAARGPLVLAVDDAQWCDAGSLRFLAYLARRLDTHPMLLVVAGRTVGDELRQQAPLTELALEPDARLLRPAALSYAATVELVSAGLGTEPAPLFAEACHRTTAGNPMLLSHLLRALAADDVRPDAAHADRVLAIGTRAVSSTVLMRLRGLPDDVVDVARAAAVLGDGASSVTVADLAGVAEDRAVAALGELTRAEVLGDHQPISFVHPVVRDALHQSLAAVERARWHERAAGVLRARGGSDEQVAAHLLVAPARGDEQVGELLRSAAAAAADRGAPESAATYLRRALDEQPQAPWRPTALLQLGMLEAAFDGAAGVAHLEEAYRLHPDPARRGEIALACGATHVFASPPGVATAFAREAAACLPPGAPGSADQRQGLVALQRMAGFLHAHEDGWRTPAPTPEGHGPGAQMLAATIALESLVAGTDREGVVAMARRALADDQLLGVDDGLFWINAAVVLTVCEEPLGDFWSRARRVASARGSLFATLSINLWEGFERWLHGDLDGALACLGDGLEQDRMWGGTGIGEAVGRAFSVCCHLDRGDVAAARRVADGLTPGPVFGEGGRLLSQARARLLLAEGRPAEALATLDEAPVGIAIANPVWNPWRAVRAAALHALGEAAAAQETAAAQVDLLRSWGAPGALGQGLCQLGELRGADGVDDLREAVALLSRTPAALALARARCALGRLPRVPDAEAVPLLLAAHRTAEELGAGGLHEAAREGLGRRGHPVVGCPEAPRGPSPTERRVVDLAASGLAPEVVARRLFLTPATVRRILDEVGSSRPQVGAGMLDDQADRRRS